jgi:hypothetical protein
MANERSPAGGPSGLIAASKTIVARGQLIRRSSHADESLTCENAPMTDAAGSVSPLSVRKTVVSGSDIGAQLSRIEGILDRILCSLAPLACAL